METICACMLVSQRKWGRVPPTLSATSPAELRIAGGVGGARFLALIREIMFHINVLLEMIVHRSRHAPASILRGMPPSRRRAPWFPSLAHGLVHGRPNTPIPRSGHRARIPLNALFR